MGVPQIIQNETNFILKSMVWGSSILGFPHLHLDFARLWMWFVVPFVCLIIRPMKSQFVWSPQPIGPTISEPAPILKLTSAWWSSLQTQTPKCSPKSTWPNKPKSCIPKPNSINLPQDPTHSATRPAATPCSSMSALPKLLASFREILEDAKDWAQGRQYLLHLGLSKNVGLIFPMK